jgi:hypothetical protein
MHIVDAQRNPDRRRLVPIREALSPDVLNSNPAAKKGIEGVLVSL